MWAFPWPLGVTSAMLTRTLELFTLPTHSEGPRVESIHRWQLHIEVIGHQGHLPFWTNSDQSIGTHCCKFHKIRLTSSSLSFSAVHTPLVTLKRGPWFWCGIPPRSGDKGHKLQQKAKELQMFSRHRLKNSWLKMGRQQDTYAVYSQISILCIGIILLLAALDSACSKHHQKLPTLFYWYPSCAIIRKNKKKCSILKDPSFMITRD